MYKLVQIMGWLEFYLIGVCKIPSRQGRKARHNVQIKINHITPELVLVCGKIRTTADYNSSWQVLFLLLRYLSRVLFKL